MVLEISKSESTSDRFPECLLPKIINGLLSNFLCERDSFKSSVHIRTIISLNTQYT